MPSSNNLSARLLPTDAPALFLSADAIDLGSKQLMGRQSAGFGFLRGFIDRSLSRDAQALSIVCQGGDSSGSLRRRLAAAGWARSVKTLPAEQMSRWSDIGVLHYPAPFSDELGFRRTRLPWGYASFAFSGITHTISSRAVMRQIAAYVHGPFASHDALICTSQSVRHAVESIWREQTEHLSWRLGQTIAPSLPMLPVIPLGIHADDFAPDDSLRAAAREQWQMSPDEIVVLFVGRLSLHAKANPLPMYLACARAQAASGRPVRVLECGWFANDPIRKSFEETASAVGIRVDRVDGREAGMTRRAYAAADIFMSLSDNIQETFGLTPVEAMAAGLPVVGSDWDGYRETVRHEVDGFLVKTHQAADEPCAAPLIEAYEDGRISYDQYVAYAHLLVAVDIDACTDALLRLISNPALRKTLGENGRKRAREVFDWKNILPQYDALWHEQWARLQAKRTIDGQAPRPDPGMPNPVRMFAHYASANLTLDTWLHRNEHPGLSPSATRELGMWRYASGWLPNARKVEQAWQLAPTPDSNPLSVQQWASLLQITPIAALRLAAWMAKTGLIKVES